MTWHEFWDTVSVAQAAIWVVGGLAVLTFIVKAWPFIRNTFRILDSLVRLPDVMDKFDDMTQQVADIHHEVHYNNGTSVKDAVMRVEVGVKGLHKRVDLIDRTAAEVRADLVHEREPERRRATKKEPQ